MPLVLRKGSGRVLRTCLFLILPPFKSVWIILAFNLLNRGIRLSARMQRYACLSCYVGFLNAPINITFQTVTMKTLQNLTYNVIYILDISGREMIRRSSNKLLTITKAYMGKKQSRIGGHLYFFFVCIIITPILICGCSHFNEGFQDESTFKEANYLFSQGSYKASLNKYQQISEKYPTTGDRVLFEMGIVYAYPEE